MGELFASDKLSTRGRGRPKGTTKLKQKYESPKDSNEVKTPQTYVDNNEHVSVQQEQEHSMFYNVKPSLDKKISANVLEPKIILSVDHLRKKYKDRSEYVFEDISFEIYEGDIVGIMGENGAGKSTLLKSISGITPIDKGEIFLEGISIEDNRDKLGVLWVEAGMFFEYTVARNLELWCTLYGVKYDQKKILELLDEFGVGKLLYTKYSLLSTGQKRKVCIARTFLNDVSMYILDEATSGLDIASQQKVQEFIKGKAINESKTFLLVTHLYTDLLNLCTKIMLIDRGKLVDYCTISQLHSRYLSGYIFTLLMSVDVTTRELLYSYLDEQKIQYIVGKGQEGNLVMLYLKYKAIQDFNKHEPILRKYILSKTVDNVSLEAFINLLLQGVIFKPI